MRLPSLCLALAIPGWSQAPSPASTRPRTAIGERAARRIQEKGYH